VRRALICHFPHREFVAFYLLSTAAAAWHWRSENCGNAGHQNNLVELKMEGVTFALVAHLLIDDALTQILAAILQKGFWKLFSDFSLSC
jgi:hypothetical protein